MRTSARTVKGERVKKKAPKLQLNRETLLDLAPAKDLDKVQGGTSYLCSQSCNLHCIIQQNSGRWCA
jgi:hypothetical protein